MFASITVKTHKRPHLLKRLLDSLARQTLPSEQFEIIVVSDGPDPETARVCDRMLSELPNLRLISPNERVGVASASNIGIRAARGDFLLMTDDDCIPRADWAQRMVESLQEWPIVVGCITSPVANYIKLCHNISAFHGFMNGRKPGPVDFIAGANLGLTRAVLKDLNGFEEGRMIAPDTEFMLRAREKGYRARYSPYPVVIHDPDRTELSAILKHSARHASATILLRHRYREILGTPIVLRSRYLILLTAPLIALKTTLGIYLGNLRLARLFWTAPLVYLLKLAWCWGAFRGLRNQKPAD
jgi:GT2 family glycosyltransferase